MPLARAQYSNKSSNVTQTAILALCLRLGDTLGDTTQHSAQYNLVTAHVALTAEKTTAATAALRFVCRILSSYYGRQGPKKTAPLYPPVRMRKIERGRARPARATSAHHSGAVSVFRVVVPMQREKEGFLRRAGACLRLVVTLGGHACTPPLLRTTNARLSTAVVVSATRARRQLYAQGCSRCRGSTSLKRA